MKSRMVVELIEELGNRLNAVRDVVMKKEVVGKL